MLEIYRKCLMQLAQLWGRVVRPNVYACSRPMLKLLFSFIKPRSARQHFQLHVRCACMCACIPEGQVEIWICASSVLSSELVHYEHANRPALCRSKNYGYLASDLVVLTFATLHVSHSRGFGVIAS